MIYSQPCEYLLNRTQKHSEQEQNNHYITARTDNQLKETELKYKDQKKFTKLTTGVNDNQSMTSHSN